MTFYNRKRNRLQNFDYSSENYYFITICTYDKRCIFGKPGLLNQFGLYAKQAIEKIPVLYPYVEMDNYIVMPNHVHMIMVMKSENNQEKRLTVSEIIGQYKMSVTKQIRCHKPEMQVWQRSFHDHIIRNQESYEKIWNYVEHNDEKWNEDCLYTEN